MIRPAYPDELARAKSLLNGHAVPPEATFLVIVKEHPVERIIASIPWWQIPQRGSDDIALRFHLPPSHLTPETLTEILTQLDNIAHEKNIAQVFTDFSLTKDHPLYQQLTTLGYEVAQTDRYFKTPGESFKSRFCRIYQRIQHRLPAHWKVESIRGHDPQKLFALIHAHHLMSPQQFQNYWTSSQGERFEEKYSFVILDGEEMIGLFLLTSRGATELHIHAECVHPDYLAQSSLIATTLRHATCSNCPEGFPETFTFRVDSEKHRQTGNTAIRQGGTEDEPRHFLKKNLTS